MSLLRPREPLLPHPDWRRRGGLLPRHRDPSLPRLHRLADPGAALQGNVWAHGLDPAADPIHPAWREELAGDCRHPTLEITYEEALAHRQRRIYLPILAIVRLTWLIRTAALSQVGLPASAAIGALAGWLVLAVVAVGYLLAVVVTFRPRTWKGRPELRSAAIGKWEVG